MMYIWRFATHVTFILGTLCCIGTQAIAQPPLATAAQIVSPSVVASWVAERTLDGTKLRLLVLWRGQVGWFLSSGGGSSTEYSSRPEPGGTIRQQIAFGGVTQVVRFDREARVAQIGDVVIALAESNVVLVDHVADPSGALVLGTRKIDSDISTGRIQLADLTGFTDELVAYLQCENTLPDALSQTMAMVTCNALRDRR